MGIAERRSTFAVAAVGLATVAAPLDRPIEPGGTATIPAAPARHVSPAPEQSTAARAPGRAGHVRVVPGASRVYGHGVVHRFRLEVEGGLPVRPRVFVRTVERILADHRSWAARGGFALRRVSKGPVSFTVTLARPATTDRLCYPLATQGRLSCWNGRSAVLNFRRWRLGAKAYASHLRAYRTYVVNHEVGHGFGHGHAQCSAAGDKAPVMMQQTKGVSPCRPNPWPLRSEVGWAG